MPRAVVTGGAGFLGSHVCERLLGDGWDVVCFDSLITGNKANLEGVLDDDSLEWEQRDVTLGLDVAGPVDWVLHLASPASPVDYLRHPVETLEVGSAGTRAALDVALAKEARFLLASTSEVYGDPEVHPQPETYWGHVNPVGPRSCYDEAKRYAEALTVAYRRVHDTNVAIARIFNTFGPRLRMDDGRAVPTFIRQALAGEPLTVHGNGTQTRSMCYVDDLVEGIVRLADSKETGPMNIGSASEISMRRLAETIRELAGSESEIVFTERPVDDPELRRPDISFAKRALAWEPLVPLEEGLRRTIEWARENWL